MLLYLCYSGAILICLTAKIWMKSYSRPGSDSNRGCHLFRWYKVFYTVCFCPLRREEQGTFCNRTSFQINLYIYSFIFYPNEIPQENVYQIFLVQGCQGSLLVQLLYRLCVMSNTICSLIEKINVCMASLHH